MLQSSVLSAVCDRHVKQSETYVSLSHNYAVQFNTEDCNCEYIKGFTSVSVLSESNMSDRCRTSFSTCIRTWRKLCCKYKTRKFKAFNLAVLLVSIFL